MAARPETRQALGDLPAAAHVYLHLQGGMSFLLQAKAAWTFGLSNVLVVYPARDLQMKQGE